MVEICCAENDVGVDDFRESGPKGEVPWGSEGMLKNERDGPPQRKELALASGVVRGEAGGSTTGTKRGGAAVLLPQDV